MALDCLGLLLAGKIFDAALCPFVNVGNDFAMYAYMLIIFALELAIFLKTEDLMIPAILAVFISIATFSSYSLITIPPEFMSGALIVLAINFGIIIYNIFRG